MATRALVLALAATALACGGDTGTVRRLTVTFETPRDGETVFGADIATVRVKATGGVRRITLAAGTVDIGGCEVAESETTLTCEKTFDPRNVAAQVVNGKLALRAEAFDSKDNGVDARIEIAVKPLAIRFAAPEAGALLRGTSALRLETRSEVPVVQVVVTADDGLPLRQFSSEPWEGDIDWAAFLGPGAHRLRAEATDTQARTDAAVVDVRVACGSDLDCESGRCCSSGECAPAGTECG